MDEPQVFLYESHGLEDTARLARALAELAVPGTVWALDGDLGAGKTAFSQAAARALGVTDTVNSPTFTIIKEYEGTEFPFYHMDVYRLSSEEAGELGLDEYFYGGGLTVVEWASLIGEWMPEDHLAVYIENKGPDDRLFRLTPRGLPYTDWCRRLKENGLLI
ncbi:tRNA (adenosine(37)-N6)-threonylcarbamoyltransferase complex ATPase subunit type 1 TsaE [Paenibacillus aurantius]|uniref:tRNA threonylcarbamoyladenosine biosynthesis protein TsaE n=1 Tax=Paenibacillus aurantius TaxID=2918900 RepID=A0AA96LB95_9BACL|nr:tRNA (adenosine(37)-N6)-threonylcarbamoyltransferase complex ATPase subunit type 1 TsaE [Paenibacillus aurantius]WNQ10447.1 tRNA (adenosine(37)-N6)-threonylcarbamoyltransferase complex ATPase subunit type 1 TsaE [Paenibacillus aurantius]